MPEATVSDAEVISQLLEGGKGGRNGKDMIEMRRDEDRERWREGRGKRSLEIDRKWEAKKGGEEKRNDE